MLPKVDKANMAEMMERIKEYLRSYHGVMRVSLANIIRKTIVVQTYGDYPKYLAPNDNIIAMMLHLPLYKNKLYNEKNAQSVKEHTAEYKINNRSIDDILGQICMDTNLYPNF